MKKLFALTLAILMLVPVFGCAASNPNNDTPTTQPTESTALQTDATEPTVPTEATEPPETTAPTPTTLPPVSASSGDLYIDEETAARLPSEEELAECQFEAWYGAPWLGGTYKFGYVGESGTITLPGVGLTIEIPEEWVDDLTIVWTNVSENYWRLDICCTELVRAYIARRDHIAPEDVDRVSLIKEAPMHFELQINAFYGETPETDGLAESGCLVGNDETFTYTFNVRETIEKRNDGRWPAREDMIEALGEDTYYDLLGDLVITEEMAKEMITIVNPISE